QKSKERKGSQEMNDTLTSNSRVVAAMEATADMSILNLASSNLPYGADCGEYGRAGDIVHEYMDAGLTPRSHVDMYGDYDPFSSRVLRNNNPATPDEYLPGCGPNICAPLVQISPDEPLL